MKIDVIRLEKTLKALGNRRRLAIVAYLKKTSVASVGDIAKASGASFKAASKHLGILFAADIVEREQTSVTMNYSLSKSLSAAAKSVIGHL